MTTTPLLTTCSVIAALLALAPSGHAQSPHKNKSHKTPPAKASSGTWQANSALLKQLAPEVSLGGYSVRPPQGYELEQQPEEGDSYVSVRYRWKGEKRTDQTRPAFSVTILSTKQGYHPNNPDKALNGNQRSIQSNLQGYTQSVLEEGSLHDIDFSRLYWKGIGNDPPSHIHGFTYKGVDSFTVITIIALDSEPYNKNTLALMEAAAGDVPPAVAGARTMPDTQTLIEALYSIPENGKAEIIDGEIIRMSPTGSGPGRASMRIASRLSLHEELQGGGYAFPDNVGFLVNLPDRKSFSPDAAWYTGTLPAENLDFLPSAPAFAVEVRSKNDDGPRAERAITQKIADYFAAGTQIVWDVDLLGPDTVKSYRASDPTSPVVFRRGDTANAEPVVPGWTLPVDALFH